MVALVITVRRIGSYSGYAHCLRGESDLLLPPNQTSEGQQTGDTVGVQQYWSPHSDVVLVLRCCGLVLTSCAEDFATSLG